MSLLQSSGSVQRLADASVFAEEGLAMILYPIQHLLKQTHTNTRTHTHTILHLHNLDHYIPAG